MKDKQKGIIENYIHAYNNFDIEGMTKDLHDQLHFQNIANGEVDLSTEGLEQFRAQAEAAKTYFKERQQSIKSWDFQGPLVKIEIHYEGILAIDLQDGVNAGDTLEQNGVSEFEFEGDKIIRIVDRS